MRAVRLHAPSRVGVSIAQVRQPRDHGRAVAGRGDRGNAQGPRRDHHLRAAGGPAQGRVSARDEPDRADRVRAGKAVSTVLPGDENAARSVSHGVGDVLVCVGRRDPGSGHGSVRRVLRHSELVRLEGILGHEPEAARAVGDQSMRILVARARGQRDPVRGPRRVPRAVGPHVLREDVVDDHAYRRRVPRVRPRHVSAAAPVGAHADEVVQRTAALRVERGADRRAAGIPIGGRERGLGIETDRVDSLRARGAEVVPGEEVAARAVAHYLRARDGRRARHRAATVAGPATGDRPLDGDSLGDHRVRAADLDPEGLEVALGRRDPDRKPLIRGTGGDRKSGAGPVGEGGSGQRDPQCGGDGSRGERQDRSEERRAA